jgi:hypothetical protein
LGLPQQFQRWVLVLSTSDELIWKPYEIRLRQNELLRFLYGKDAKRYEVLRYLSISLSDLVPGRDSPHHVILDSCELATLGNQFLPSRNLVSRSSSALDQACESSFLKRNDGSFCARAAYSMCISLEPEQTRLWLVDLDHCLVLAASRPRQDSIQPRRLSPNSADQPRRSFLSYDHSLASIGLARTSTLCGRFSMAPC